MKGSTSMPDRWLEWVCVAIGFRRHMAWIGWLWCGVVGTAQTAPIAVDFVGFTNLTRFQVSAESAPGELVLISPELPIRQGWTEAIPSWNIRSNLAITVELRARTGERWTRYYSLGNWSLATNRFPRTSEGSQLDSDGEVRTDTVVLRNPSTHLQLRLRSRTPKEFREGFRFLGVSLLNTAIHGTATPSRNETSEPVTLDVPIRSQADYPEGVSQWCSPTSLTMVLAYYAKRLQRESLSMEVRDVAHAVYDPGWPGTGNWAFNMAFAGAQPGLRAVVLRMPELATLEAWLSRGVPVIASVSYAQLNGREIADRSDGHLVVVVGFDRRGDVLVNDPGVRMERVRRTITRADFQRAWGYSRNTTYVVCLETQFEAMSHWTAP